MVFSLRIPDELDSRLRAAAAARYMSLNALILHALDRSPVLQGVEVPKTAREPGKFFSEAEALAIAKSPAVVAPAAIAKPSKAQTRAYMEQKRLERRGR